MAFPARAVRNDLAAAPRKARCSRSSNFLSACQAPSFNLPCSGLRKKLLPSRVKEPRFPPSILRRTAYFQYAAWSATSGDVVAPRSRAPRGFFCGYSLEGLFEIRSVPGLFFVGFIKQGARAFRNPWWPPREAWRREILESMAFSFSGVNALVFCFEEFAPS